MPQAFCIGMAAQVLLVVDSAEARTLYGEYLEFCGFRVITAVDGEQAVASARMHLGRSAVKGASRERPVALTFAPEQETS